MTVLNSVPSIFAQNQWLFHHKGKKPDYLSLFLLFSLSFFCLSLCRTFSWCLPFSLFFCVSIYYAVLFHFSLIVISLFVLCQGVLKEQFSPLILYLSFLNVGPPFSDIFIYSFHFNLYAQTSDNGQFFSCPIILTSLPPQVGLTVSQFLSSWLIYSHRRNSAIG